MRPHLGRKATCAAAAFEIAEISAGQRPVGYRPGGFSVLAGEQGECHGRSAPIFVADRDAPNMSKKIPWYVYAGMMVVIMIAAPITTSVLDDYHVRGPLYRGLATLIVAFAVLGIYFYLAGRLVRWIGGDKDGTDRDDQRR
jgi:hypothetical protein